MRQRKLSVGRVVLAAVAVLIALAVFGSLFRVALFAGAIFVVWKLFFAESAPVERTSVRLAEPPDLSLPLPVDAVDALEQDEERARLDRELAQAIEAAKARQAPDRLAS